MGAAHRRNSVLCFGRAASLGPLPRGVADSILRRVRRRIASAHRHVVDNGAEHSAPPLRLADRCAFSWVRTPSGNWLELVQYADYGPLTDAPRAADRWPRFIRWRETGEAFLTADARGGGAMKFGSWCRASPTSPTRTDPYSRMSRTASAQKSSDSTSVRSPPSLQSRAPYLSSPSEMSAIAARTSTCNSSPRYSCCRCNTHRCSGTVGPLDHISGGRVSARRPARGTGNRGRCRGSAVPTNAFAHDRIDRDPAAAWSRNGQRPREHFDFDGVTVVPNRATPPPTQSGSCARSEP